MLNHVFTYVASKSARRVRSIAVGTSVALFAGLMVTVGADTSVAQAVDPTVLCGMCLTEPSVTGVSATGSSKITVNGGGVYTNSAAAPAISLTGSARIVTNAQVRAVGTIVSAGASQLSGTPAAGLVGPLFFDPYRSRASVVSVGPNDSTVDYVQSSGGLIPARPDASFRDVLLTGSGVFTFPDAHRYRDVTVGGSATATLKPGRYRNITSGGNSKVVLLPGIYWLAGSLNMTGSSQVSGMDASLALACSTAAYDTRVCEDEAGGRLSITGTAQLTLSGNTSRRPSIVFVAGNTAEITMSGSSKLVLSNSGIFAPSASIGTVGSASITAAGVIHARRVSLAGTSTITVSIVPDPVVIPSVPAGDLQSTPVQTGEQFFGLGSPQTQFKIQGSGIAAGASVDVRLAEPLPTQYVEVTKVSDEPLPGGVSASDRYDFSLVGDQSRLLSATLTIPFLPGSVSPSELNELWVAYRDEESGFWIPEENAPTVDSANNAVSVVTTHFSERVVLKNRPVNGAWTNPFLDAMFGPFPAQCVPVNTPGLIPGGKIALLFDTSGSMAFENRDQQAVAFAKQLAGGLRSIDEPGVYWLDESGPNGEMWGLSPWTKSALDARLNTASSAFGGLAPFLDPKTSLRNLLTVAEQDVASPANVFREIVLFTDDEGLSELFSTNSLAALLDPESPTNQGTLSGKGIRLTIVAWPNAAGLPARWINNSNQYVRIVRPYASTGKDLAADLRKRLNRLADSGADTDGDGLTTCEESALFFPNPNFPGGSIRNPADSPSVFFSHTKPTVPDTDFDGSSDGSEIARRKISLSPVVSRAFANLLGQGIDSYFVAVTGRPDSADTDGDTLSDPPAGKFYETCLSGEPSPLLADSDSDGTSDATECAQGTNPNLGQLTLRANPWFADYESAQRKLDLLTQWKGAKVSTGVGTFTTSPALARFGRIRLTGFIPQDETASTPCWNNQRFITIDLTPDECTGYLGDFRDYATSYADHRNRYLPRSRYILDVDFLTGVWGLLVHPTCERGPTGACHNAFPIATGDLSGFFKRRVTDFLGGQRKQLADIKRTANGLSVQGKVVQSDSGLDSDLFRPGADFLATFELLTPNTAKIHFNADGFPAAEAFWIPKRGAPQNLFNSNFAVKTAPSAFGMVIGEFDVLSSVFTGCNPLDYTVKTSQGCVALAYEVDGFLNLNG